MLRKRYYYLAIKGAKYCNATVTGTSTLSKQNAYRKSEAKSTAQLQVNFKLLLSTHVNQNVLPLFTVIKLFDRTYLNNP